MALFLVDLNSMGVGPQTLVPRSQLNTSEIKLDLQSVREFLEMEPLEIAVLFLSVIPAGEQRGITAADIDDELSASIDTVFWYWHSEVNTSLLQEKLEGKKWSKLEMSVKILKNPDFRESLHFKNMDSGKQVEAEVIKELLLQVNVSPEIASMVKEIYIQHILYQEQKKTQQKLSDQQLEFLIKGLHDHERVTTQRGTDSESEDLSHEINPFPKGLGLYGWRNVELEGISFRFQYVSYGQRGLVIEITYDNDNGEKVLLKGESALLWMRENIWASGRGEGLSKDGTLTWIPIGDRYRVYPSGWIDDTEIVDHLFRFYRFYQGYLFNDKPEFRATAKNAIVKKDLMIFLLVRHFWSKGPPLFPRYIVPGKERQAMERYALELHRWLVLPRDFSDWESLDQLTEAHEATIQGWGGPGSRDLVEEIETNLWQGENPEVINERRMKLYQLIVQEIKKGKKDPQNHPHVKSQRSTKRWVVWDGWLFKRSAPSSKDHRLINTSL